MLLIKRHRYLQDKQRLRREFSAPSPALQHSAKLLYSFIEFSGNSPTLKKQKVKKKEEEGGGFGRYHVALYVCGADGLHKYGSNTE